MTSQGRGCRRASSLLVALPLLVLAACTGEASSAAKEQTLTLYTCVSDTTVQPVIKSFEQANTGSRVALFRAPTGQLNARVEADARSGGLKADVIWGCDPLTMQNFVAQNLVGGWTPSGTDAVPMEYRTDDYVGAALLYLVAIHRTSVPGPKTWSDLTGAAYRDGVAVPDPAVAATALGAVGYFSTASGYGAPFYAKLKQNGAVQVGTPDEVTTGVAQGSYEVGMTTANSAYEAKKQGSPVDVAWPEPGAVAIYGPIALARHSSGSSVAKSFISFVISKDGQTAIGAAGSYPTLPGVPGPTIPAGAPVVFPDWAAIGRDKSAVLSSYQQLFGR